MKVEVRQLSESAMMPVYATKKSAGMDLCAIVPQNMKWIAIPPGRAKMIHTGIAMSIPDGYFGAIFARSGLALKEGLRPANCVGVVDSDYRGEIMVPLRNDSDVSKYIKEGERIAQMVFIPYERAELEIVDGLDETERGEGGFGSTD